MDETSVRSPSAPFTINRDSPLAVGRRATLAELLLRHDLQDVLDALAFAELCRRHEPDPVYDWWNFPPCCVARRTGQHRLRGENE